MNTEALNKSKTKSINIPRVVFAATQSSSGKTTVVTGLLRALKNRGITAQPFKVGPDYIDPSYHGMAAGRAGHNLDTWLTPEDRINDLFAKESEGADIAVIEGVMGLYDGGKNGVSSTAQLAKKLNAPVILVINVQSMGDSAAAIALGFKLYDEGVNLAGAVLNRLGSATHKALIEEAMAKINIPVFGAIFRDDSVHMPERHLGLTPAQENDASRVIDIISEKIAREVYVDKIIALAKSAPPIEISGEEAADAKQPDAVVAVAMDKAFSFYYPASLDELKKQGAEIEFFSPLEDESIPENADALIFGGGFPEIFANELAKNSSMLESVRRAADRKMPIYAECGGFMYLMEGIYDFDGNFHQMAGLIPARAEMNKKLQTVGYVEAKISAANIFGRAGAKFHGHEFHFSSQKETKQADFPWAFEFTKMRSNAKYKAGYAKDNILGSYLHLHFCGAPEAAASFMNKAREYKNSKR